MLRNELYKAAILLFYSLLLLNADYFQLPQIAIADDETTNWFHLNACIFNVRYVLPLNMSSSASITMDVAVPENTAFQKLISFSSDPMPNSTYKDGHGITRLRYELRTNTAKLLNITLHYTVLVLFSSLTGKLCDGSSEENIPADILEKYTKPAPYIESDNPNIIGNASLISGNGDLESKVLNLFNFVANRTLFKYDESVQDIIRDPFSHVRGALWTLQNRKGVCFDFAHLFVALLRAIGIPSRVSEGIILDGRSGFILHDWAEVYFPNVGWVPFDPTWNQSKCNVHMKILNPLYDECMRWNYSILKGWLYKFPKNATYTINDQVYIENVTYPVVTDLFTLSKQHIFFARELKINNETFFSQVEVNKHNFILCNRYCALQLNVTYQEPFIGYVSYAYMFSINLAEKMKIQVSAPLRLIFSKPNKLNFGGFSCESSPIFGEIQFTIIEPELWMLSIIAVAIITVILIVVKKRLKN